MNELALQRSNDEGLRELALFSGAGGGILGGHLLGWRTVCAVEWEPYAAGVLVARQNDGVLPAFPVWDDVQTFDGRPWRGIVNVVSGGFPCQDISAAGGGKGIEGERSGMWKHMARIVGEVLPRFVFVENSPLLVGRGLAVVLGDLADLGYDAQWFRLSASDCGAPHQRDRFWLVAYASEKRFSSSAAEQRVGGRFGFAKHGLASEWWRAEPGQAAREIECRLGRAANGVAARVDRLKAIGNGQVPRVAAAAFTLLSGNW